MSRAVERMGAGANERRSGGQNPPAIGSRSGWLALGLAALIATAMSSIGCTEEAAPIIIDGGDSSGGGTTPKDTLTQVAETLAEIAYASYSDSLATAQQLSERIDDLVDDPSPVTMRAAKAAWLDAREPYGQTEVYRFQAGPIDALRDDGMMGADGDGPEGRMNAWPLAEALIDYVEPTFTDGAADPPQLALDELDFGENIIEEYTILDAADPSVDVPIDETVIESFNELGGEESVATGYHAIEFLLWGQDTNEQPPFGPDVDRDASPGQRAHTDYLPVGIGCLDGGGENDTCDKRAEYLQAAMALLIADLTRVVAAWAPDTAGNYREAFVADPGRSVGDMMTAMGLFGEGELAGERMTTALITARPRGSQEDEHSCFSDNTHRDILLNALGIQNVFLGRYRGDTPVTGKGIYDLLVERGFAGEADSLRDAIAASMTAVGAIDDEQRINGVTFDLLIQESINQFEVVDAITKLELQTDALEDAIDVLDL